MDSPQGGFLSRHTIMPPRNQKTPHGDVTLTSKWMRDHYMLMASGSRESLRWLFPNMQGEPESNGKSFRHAFVPSPKKITVERELRRVCSKWQDAWNDRLEDHVQDSANTESAVNKTASITTLGQLFDHLYEQRKASVARSTSDRDRYRLLLWRDEIGNDALLADLSVERITSALARIGKRTSAPTANPALGVLKTYLNWAANMGLLKNQGYRTVRPLKEPASTRHHRAWWTAAEVELALRCAGDDPHQPTATLLVACGCYLGLRVEEIIMLRWQDLSLDATDPKTGEPKPVCHLTPNNGWQPKDGEARDIPICTPLLELLKKYRQVEGFLLQAEEGRPGRPRGGKGWIYRYNPKNVWLRVMKQVVAAGGKAITHVRHASQLRVKLPNCRGFRRKGIALAWPLGYPHGAPSLRSFAELRR
jgi:integrase